MVSVSVTVSTETLQQNHCYGHKMAGGIFRDISASNEATPLDFDYFILLFRYSKIHNNKNEKMNPDAVSLMDP